MKTVLQQLIDEGEIIMQHPPYYEEPPKRGDFSFVPRGKANCYVNEIIEFQGQSMRNRIGRAWAHQPLSCPIIADTTLGTLEIINIPPNDGFGLFDTPTSGLSDGAEADIREGDFPEGCEDYTTTHARSTS